MHYISQSVRFPTPTCGTQWSQLVVPVIYAIDGGFFYWDFLYCGFVVCCELACLGTSLFAGVLSILFQSVLLLVVGLKKCNRSFWIVTANFHKSIGILQCSNWFLMWRVAEVYWLVLCVSRLSTQWSSFTLSVNECCPWNSWLHTFSMWAALT